MMPRRVAGLCVLLALSSAVTVAAAAPKAVLANPEAAKETKKEALPPETVAPKTVAPTADAADAVGAQPEAGDPADAAPGVDAGGTAEGEQGGRLTAIEARIVVKVKSAEDARKAILAGTAAAGGFASLITDNALDLKVPPAALSKLLGLITTSGLVIDKTLERKDLTLDLATLNAQLKSKRTILSELRDLFDGSDVVATLQIERSMTDLVKELESVKGSLRVMTDRTRWAIVHVSFDFYTEQRIKYVESQFEWLNSVKLERFLGDF